MLANLLIVLGLALALAGVWLKFRGSSSPAPAPQTELSAPPPPTEAAAPALTNEDKGRAFEDWVVAHLSKQYHKLKHWRGDKKAANGTYAESNTYPDMEVELMLHDKPYRFAMECKWRNSFIGAKVELSSGQVERYRKFQQEKGLTVFIVLGIGGQPSAPNELYIIPLRDLPSGQLDMKGLGAFRQKMTSKVFYYDPFNKDLRL